jgi:hypothetical protein
MDDAAVVPAGRVVRKVFFTFVTLTIVIGSMTVLFLGMRAVMDVGGACSTGSAFEIATPCPDGTWLVPVSIWVGIIALAFYIGNRSGLPGPEWWTLAWPALFLSLGYNFWEYGLNPPPAFGSGVEWGWIVCGVVFVIMGGAPLIGILWSPELRRDLLWADAEPPPKPSGPKRGGETARDLARKVKPRVRPQSTTPKPRPDAGATGATYAGAVKVEERGATATTTVPSGDGTDDLAEDLERLAALFRDGELTVDEYAAAKRRRIAGDGT